MCYTFILRYTSCSRDGAFTMIPCETPTTCGYPVTRRHSHSFTPFPDLCPGCFLGGQLFKSKVNDWRRAEILEDDLYKSRTTETALKLAESLWTRAENDTSRNDDLNCFNNQVFPAGVSDLTHIMIICVIRFLYASFWHDVIEKETSPSKFRRTLILQILNFKIAYLYFSVGRRLGASIRAKLNRPAYLEGKLNHTSMLTLAADERDCPICRDQIGIPNADGIIESLVETSCKHLFGDQCLKSWILESETCPTCRGSLLTFQESKKLWVDETEKTRQMALPPPWLMTIFGITPETLARDLSITQMGGPELLLMSKEPVADWTEATKQAMLPFQFHS